MPHPPRDTGQKNLSPLDMLAPAVYAKRQRTNQPEPPQRCSNGVRSAPLLHRRQLLVLRRNLVWRGHVLEAFMLAPRDVDREPSGISEIDSS